MTKRRFTKSFRKIYDQLEPGEQCNFEHHYKGVLREVIHWLNLWASNRPDRFVFAEVEAIAAHCHRFKNPKSKYAPRSVGYVLAELRARGVISGRLMRMVDGEERWGFIVAPHDCLTVRTEKGCIFKGRLVDVIRGRWEREIVLKDEKGTVYEKPKIGPIFWAGYFEGAVTCAVECAVESAVESAVEGAAKGAVGHSAQSTQSEKVNPENRSLSVVSESVVGSVGSDTSEITGSIAHVDGLKNNTNGNPAREGSSSLSTTDQKQPRETIAQHFSAGVDMAGITEGEFEATEMSEQEDNVALNKLLSLCQTVITERAGRRYVGRKTNGDIMAEAMIRFTKQSGDEVPKYWYPIVKRLREKVIVPVPSPAPSSFHIRPRVRKPEPVPVSLNAVLVEAAGRANVDLKPYAEPIENLLGHPANYYGCYLALKQKQILHSFVEWLWEHRQDDTPLNAK